MCSRGDLRRVRYKHKSDIGPMGNSGWFHCWAGLAEHPIAVVEEESGSIVQLPSFCIKFVTQPETGKGKTGE